MKVSSAADLEVTNYYVEFPSTFPWANFEDNEVTLYVDGIDYTIDSSKCVGCLECVKHFDGGCYMKKVLRTKKGEQ